MDKPANLQEETALLTEDALLKRRINTQIDVKPKHKTRHQNQPVLKLCNISLIKVSVKATFNGQPLACYVTQRGAALSFPPRRFSPDATKAVPVRV